MYIYNNLILILGQFLKNIIHTNGIGIIKKECKDTKNS